MKKVLVTLLTIGVAFTSCKTDETPAPTPTIKVDVRDAAEGLFKSTLDKEFVQFSFSKNDSIQDQMILREVEDGMEDAGGVTVLNIVETATGFDYELDEDDIIGTYDKTADIHILTVESENMEWIFERVE